ANTCSIGRWSLAAAALAHAGMPTAGIVRAGGQVRVVVSPCLLRDGCPGRRGQRGGVRLADGLRAIA
ncbi:MAG: hypothetical protein ACRDIL_10790, partial [Candidatus Limnocylindrales bacterium]